MKFRSIKLTNFRGVQTMDPIELADITVFVGANNAGKSTMLRAFLGLQNNMVRNPSTNVRHGATRAEALISATIEHLPAIWANQPLDDTIVLQCSLHPGGGEMNVNARDAADTKQVGSGIVPNTEGQAILIPFLSSRRVSSYNQVIKAEYANLVGLDFGLMAAKINRLRGNPSVLADFNLKCKNILGFAVDTLPSLDGMDPSAVFGDEKHLSLTQLGDGIPHIVGLLLSLIGAKNKLFLLEEPENDLHPSALRQLLATVRESAVTNNNQFFVSTHSNIVVRELASSVNSKVYKVASAAGSDGFPSTTYDAVDSQDARIELLDELGYSFPDLALTEGWLILEESSAETIIRSFLLPWFVKDLLGRIRTLAAGGNEKIEPVFHDFHRLILFTHLEKTYVNAAWVRTDGDKRGGEIVAELQDKFKKDWLPDRFATYSKDSFEKYYPAQFQDKVASVLAIDDKARRRTEKKSLLLQVCKWAQENEADARREFAASAQEVIEDLKRIERQLNEKRRQ